MRLQLEVLSTYTFKREIPQLMGIFMLTAQALGEADFYSIAHQFFGTQDIRDKNMDHFAREFRVFMKQNPRFSHAPEWQELVRFDWLCYLARHEHQLMMTFYPIITRSRMLRVENILRNLPSKRNSGIGRRQKQPHYYLIYCADQKIYIKSLKKIEFLILNWRRQGDSEEAMSKKLQILGLSETETTRELGKTNSFFK